MAGIMALSAALALPGCGGGGGGGGSDSTAVSAPAAAQTVVAPNSPPPVAAVDPELSTLVPSVADATYGVTSEELAVFQLLNQERSRCSFGQLAQNAALDKSSAAHAAWVNQNAIVSHTETKGTPGFTGEQVFDRVIAAGYPTDTLESTVHEEGTVEYGASVAKAGFGLRGLRRLLSGPYHANGLLGSTRDVGVAALLTSSAANGNWAGLWFNLASVTRAGPQLIAGTDVSTYPCEGTTGTAFELTNETPNPAPGRDLATTPLGQPVMVRLRDGHQLTITSAKMTQVATGADIPLRTPITSANDPLRGCSVGCFLSNEGYVIPDVALKASTAYQVAISGTNNDKVFSRSFGFTTGPGANP